MIGAAPFFFGSFALVPLLPTGFIPPDDLLADAGLRSRCRRAPRFEQTYAAAEQARAIVAKNPTRASCVYTAVGGGSAGGDPFAPRRRAPRCARPR